MTLTHVRYLLPERPFVQSEVRAGSADDAFFPARAKIARWDIARGTFVAAYGSSFVVSKLPLDSDVSTWSRQAPARNR